MRKGIQCHVLINYKCINTKDEELFINALLPYLRSKRLWMGGMSIYRENQSVSVNCMNEIKSFIKKCKNVKLISIKRVDINKNK